MSKHSRRLEPVIYDNGVFRFQVNGHIWFKDTPAGPEFRCKCQERTHIVTWLEDIPTIHRILASHRDELWNLLCDQQRLVLALPLAHYKAEHPTTRLVGVIWPTDRTLTFVS